MFWLGTSALTVPALAASFSVGGGTITTTQADNSTDDTGTSGGFALQPNTTGGNDVVTISGVTINNTSGAPSGRALDLGYTLPSSGSYSVAMQGSNLASAAGSGVAAFIESSAGGNITFNSTGGAANTISGPIGINLNGNGGNVSINTGSDAIAASGPTGEIFYATTTSTGTISIDSAGATLTSSGSYGISAVSGGNGAITIGGLNGGIASSLTVNSGYGIYASSVSSPTHVTVAAAGSVIARTGVYLQGGAVTVDNFGIINATQRAVDATDSNSLTVTLEPGSTTSGLIYGSNGTNVYNIMGGANIAGASFDGGAGSSVVLNLEGSGNGTLNIAALNHITGFNKYGTGTWALTGTPLIGTPWTIYQGTLAVSTGANLAGNLTLAGGTLEMANGFSSQHIITVESAGGTFQVDSGSAAVSSIVDGGGGPPGMVTKIGNGTLIYGPLNTYTGLTVISAGALQIGNAQANSPSQPSGLPGTIAGNVLNNSALVFDNGATSVYTFKGTISGSGAVMQNGFEVAFTNTNSYTGGTTIAPNSVIDIGNGGTTGSIVGDVTDNGTLNFNRSDTITFAGNISGTGQVNLQKGTVVMTGTNTYSAGTSVGPGAVLEIGNGMTSGSLTGLIDIENGGQLAFNENGLYAFSGTMANSGSVNILGGNITFNSVNTYTGGTTINGGALEIGDASHPNAQIRGPVTVNAGGVLEGHGTIAGAVGNSGGTVAPGGTIGTLTVSSFAQGAGGTLREEVSPAAASELIVTGAASLNGSLVLTPDPGTYTVGTSYTLVSAADGITGTFSTVNLGIGYGASIAPFLRYTSNTVTLTLRPPLECSGAYAATPNEIATCSGVTAGGTASTLYASLGILAATPTAVPAALDSLSGEVYTALRTTTVADDRLIRNSVLDHLAGAQDDGIVVWGDSFTSSGNIDGNANAATVSHNDTGLIAGVDVPVDDGLRAGIAVAWTGQKLSITSRASTATGQSNHVIAYANWTQDAISLRVGADYGSGSNTVRRSIAFLSQNDTGHEGNHTTQLFGEGGYSIQGNGFMMEPYANLAWVSTSSGAFAETGGASDLTGAKKADAAAYSILGVHLTHDAIALSDDLQIMPKFSLGWQTRLTALTPAQTLAFAATSQFFQVTGASLSNNALVGQLGFDLPLFDHGKLYLGYDGLISGRERDHAVNAAFSRSF